MIIKDDVWKPSYSEILTKQQKIRAYKFHLSLLLEYSYMGDLYKDM